MPGIGISITLMAVGATLTFGVSATAEGVNLDAIGVILMVAGMIGLLASLIVLSRGVSTGRSRRVVRERDVIDRDGRV